MEQHFKIILALLGMLISLVFHEQMHARAAYWLGDPTGRNANRFSWNPIHHLDPFMSVALPLLTWFGSRGGFIFGGAKPCPINPNNFRNPSLGMCLSAAAGPLSNFFLAGAAILLCTVLYRAAPSSIVAGHELTANGYFLVTFMFTNLVLGAFNLLPLPPLDGSRILRHFSPRGIQEAIDALERFGMLLVIVVVYFGSAQIIQPVLVLGYRILVELNGHAFKEALKFSL